MDLRRSWLTWGLVALLAVDVALVSWALWPAPVPSAAPVSASAGSFSQTPADDATPSPSGSGPGSPAPSSTASPTADDAAPITRMVAVATDRVVWLAESGTCARPGRVHVTRDAGRRWSTEAAPGAVTRLRPSDGRQAFVVAGDDGCALRLWDTSDAGQSWAGPRSAAAAWGRNAEDATLVARPGGDPVRPCGSESDVLDLSGLRDGAAAAVCDDGRLQVTTDSGSSWATAVERAGLRAVALTAPGRGALALVGPDCDGVLVARLAGNRAGPTQCVAAARPPAGQVAVSVADGATWVVAGDALFRAPSADASTGEFTRVGDWPGS